MNTPSTPPRRYLSIWLPRLATDRLTRRAAPGPAGRSESAAPGETTPLVVVHKVKSALRIAALNDAAARLGLTVGLALADACARHPGLAIAQSDPEADQLLLEAVADWCDRYTPLVALDAPAGLMLDVTGCAHLFGGEAALGRDIVARLAAQGFHARAAVADTPGGAWAVARYAHVLPRSAIQAGLRSETSDLSAGEGAERSEAGGGIRLAHSVLPPHPPRSHAFARHPLPRGKREESIFIIPAAATGEALAPLPLAALRLEPDTVAALADVGLHRVAELLDLPRSTLAARFGETFLLRLDQALGRVEEPITPRRPAPSFMAEQHFAEPVARERDVLGTISRLGIRLGYAMETRGEGARRLELALFRSDGEVQRLAVGTSAPVRAAEQIGRLFKDRLANLAEPCDPGFGYDLVRLSAPVTERLAPAQAELAAEDLTASNQAEDIAHLIDRLGARFGLRRVARFVPRDTHIPEFAVAAVPAHAARHQLVPPPLRGRPTIVNVVHDGREGGNVDLLQRRDTPTPVPSPQGGGEQWFAVHGQDTLAPARPARLFARPERIEAIAEVPDGPPVRFRWRRALHEVAAAEGPERIALAWWRDAEGRTLTRDYFRVETRAGARVWLYREGLYVRETAQPRWFLHGLFG